MLKLFPANHLALTDTLYTALNNVRAFRSVLERIRCVLNKPIQKNTLKIKLNF
jgi:hypothetical protein